MNGFIDGIQTPPSLTLQTDRHRMLHHVPGLGLILDVHSRNELCFISLVTTESSLFLVRAGAMRVETDATALVAVEGEYILLQAGVPLKVTHLPSDAGRHEATGLLMDRKIVAEDAVPPDRQCKAAALLLGKRDERFLGGFSRACRSLREADSLPHAVVAHHLREVLLWLSLDAIFFRPAESVSVTSRLRGLLAADPGAAWLEKDAAKALGQSQATLRRRLAAEATSFREVLIEARMLYALRLLHSTDHSIGRIAESSGYACQSRFAERFRKRFGFHPSTVRGHRRGGAG